MLRTDSSVVGVAAVLLQASDGKLYPVGYASKKVNLTEARYPIIEKECLVVVWGIKRFKLYLAGRRFILQTDHKPLKYLKDASYQNDRVFPWAVAIQEYSFRMEDIPGKENIGAEFLSRTGIHVDMLVISSSSVGEGIHVDMLVISFVFSLYFGNLNFVW